jgi:hypothetical protein
MTAYYLIINEIAGIRALLYGPPAIPGLLLTKEGKMV